MGPVPKSVKNDFEKTNNRKHKNLYNKKMKIDSRDIEKDEDPMDVDAWAEVDKFLEKEIPLAQSASTTPNTNNHSGFDRTGSAKTDSNKDQESSHGHIGNGGFHVKPKETSVRRGEDGKADNGGMEDSPTLHSESKKKKKNRRKKNKERLYSFDNGSESSTTAVTSGKDPNASGPVTPMSSPSNLMPIKPNLSPSLIPKSGPTPSKHQDHSSGLKLPPIKTLSSSSGVSEKLSFNFNKSSSTSNDAPKSLKGEITSQKSSSNNGSESPMKKPKFVNDPKPKTFDNQPSLPKLAGTLKHIATNGSPSNPNPPSNGKLNSTPGPTRPKLPTSEGNGVQIQLGDSNFETPREFEPRNPELKKRRDELKEFRMKLPIYECKEALFKELMAHKSLVIIGETGSGKTTQIPQFIYDLNRKGSFKHQGLPSSPFPYPPSVLTRTLTVTLALPSLTLIVTLSNPPLVLFPTVIRSNIPYTFVFLTSHLHLGIAITQPRRIAAISVAQRVSEEMGVALGDLVGYG